MKADFSGWATKAGLKCSDGRTIMPGAFGHQDRMQVPLVWQHGHNDVKNVLGHVILENRDEGVYAYGFFNKSEQATHARELLEHKDINAMSIWANELVEKARRVLHGAIKEVSLVIGGANPGALIENVTLRHAADGSDDEILDDEVIIFTGEELKHGEEIEDDPDKKAKTGGDVQHAAGDGEETLQDIVNTMDQKQKDVLHYMVAQALESNSSASHSDLELDDEAFGEAYDSMDEAQKAVVHSMIQQARKSSKSSTEHSGTNNQSDDKKGDTIVKHNVFEDDKAGNKSEVNIISHADKDGILADALATGSVKKAVENYCLAHGIEDIDTLFPDAKAITNTPELYARRTDWVAKVLTGIKHSPFARIKTLSADLTVAEARAKGYIKGHLKKEEFFKVSKRVTTPQTVYKKQKIDRDDVIDITDFDVIVWLKGEMRLMLDEELARAFLIGDGRDAADEDKINEDQIRPVATDHELYTTVVNVNIDDTNSSVVEVIDAIVSHRSDLRGSGLPTMFVSETYISKFMLLRDQVGRRIYKDLNEVAAELRVQEIVSVPVFEDDPTLVAVLVNLTDYTAGADNGGNVTMFDDFDIDYNQYKYLIETRCSGALTKLKSALVVRKVPAAAVVVAPTPPTFDGTAVTIVNTPNVVYRNADTDAVMDAAGGPYVVAPDTTLTVHAEPAAGYYFADTDDDLWAFTRPA